MPPVVPIQDIATGGWGSSHTGALYQAVDEVTANDADFISTATVGATEFLLSSIADPGDAGDFIVKYRAQSDNGTRSVKVQLKQGTTVIAEDTKSISNVLTDYQFQLSAAAVQSITNWSDLRLSFDYLVSNLNHQDLNFKAGTYWQKRTRWNWLTDSTGPTSAPPTTRPAHGWERGTEATVTLGNATTGTRVSWPAGATGYAGYLANVVAQSHHGFTASQLRLRTVTFSCEIRSATADIQRLALWISRIGVTDNFKTLIFVGPVWTRVSYTLQLSDSTLGDGRLLVGITRDADGACDVYTRNWQIEEGWRVNSYLVTTTAPVSLSSHVDVSSAPRVNLATYTSEGNANNSINNQLTSGLALPEALGGEVIQRAILTQAYGRKGWGGYTAGRGKIHTFSFVAKQGNTAVIGIKLIGYNTLSDSGGHLGERLFRFDFSTGNFVSIGGAPAAGGFIFEGSVAPTMVRDATATSLGDGWYRLVFSFILTDLRSNYFEGIINPNPDTVAINDYMFLGQGQVEPGDAFTGHIPNLSVFIYTAGGYGELADFYFERASGRHYPKNGLLGVQNETVNFSAYEAPIMSGQGYMGFRSFRNYAYYSEDLDQATWAKTNITVAANTEIAPDGTRSADTVTMTSTAHTLVQTVPANDYSVSSTFSFWAKRGTATDAVLSIRSNSRNVDIVAPFSYYNQLPADGSWTRVQVNFLKDAADLSIDIYPLRDSGVTGTIHIWGVQYGEEYAAKAYNPSSGNTSWAGSDELYFREESLAESDWIIAVLVDIPYPNTNSSEIFRINDGSLSNYLAMFHEASLGFYLRNEAEGVGSYANTVSGTTISQGKGPRVYAFGRRSDGIYWYGSRYRGETGTGTTTVSTSSEGGVKALPSNLFRWWLPGRDNIVQRFLIRKGITVDDTSLRDLMAEVLP